MLLTWPRLRANFFLYPANWCGCSELYLAGMFLNPLQHLYPLYEGILKANTHDCPAGRNGTMFSWVCLGVPGDTEKKRKADFTPLTFSPALRETLMLCLLLFVCLFVSSFPPSMIFARADWMKNWGRHQKRLSKTWFSFRGWCDVGLQFGNDGENLHAPCFLIAPIQ